MKKLELSSQNIHSEPLPCILFGMAQHFTHINDTLETKDQHVSCPIYIFSTLPDCKSYLTVGLFVISSSQCLDFQTRFVSLAECWKRKFIMKMYYFKMWFWCLVLVFSQRPIQCSGVFSSTRNFWTFYYCQPGSAPAMEQFY